LDMAWQQRAAFVYQPEKLESSIQKAKVLAGKPVVLLDHYDNCASGGTMDTTTVLAAMLEARLEQAAAFAICDPQAAAKLKEAGVGGRVTLAIGGRTDMPALGLKGRPIEVSGTVKKISDGLYRNEGPMARGEQMDMGTSAVLDTGRVEIAVVSRQVEPFDIAAFRCVGIDPSAKRYLMIKSRVHWRAGLGHLANAVVECAGTGVCTSDYSQLQFRKVRRPAYPLDDM
ncbi:MAG: MlrC C-terminal domain-containing protein, partial [Clostridia bacterium]